MQKTVHETLAKTCISIEDLRHLPNEAVLVSKCLLANTEGGLKRQCTEDSSLTSQDMASTDSQMSAASPGAACTMPISAAARAHMQRAVACGSVTTTVGSLASDIETPKHVLPTGWLMFEARFET
jgi:hypothetical protein